MFWRFFIPCGFCQLGFAYKPSYGNHSLQNTDINNAYNLFIWIWKLNLLFLFWILIPYELITLCMKSTGYPQIECNQNFPVLITTVLIVSHETSNDIKTSNCARSTLSDKHRKQSQKQFLQTLQNPICDCLMKNLILYIILRLLPHMKKTRRNKNEA